MKHDKFQYLLARRGRDLYKAAYLKKYSNPFKSSLYEKSSLIELERMCSLNETWMVMAHFSLFFFLYYHFTPNSYCFHMQLIVFYLIVVLRYIYLYFSLDFTFLHSNYLWHSFFPRPFHRPSPTSFFETLLFGGLACKT